jgi:membrane protease YdiL (CAAX protease family)
MRRQLFLVWFVIFLVWAFYRAYFSLPEVVDEFIAKPLIFVGPVVYLVLFREKKGIGELGFRASPRNIMLDIYIGIILGILFAMQGLLANYVKYGTLAFAIPEAVKGSGGILLFLLINTATSVTEEILGRGFLYNRLFRTSGNQMGSALIGSILFLLLHLPIVLTRLHLMGTSLLVYPISILILGITNSYLFTLRGSLTLPILVHTFWNMTVALYL